MGTITSQITSLTIVYSPVYSDADHRTHQSSVSLAVVREFTCDRWIPAQIASNAENVSIWWRHHVITNQEVVDVPTTLEHDLFNLSTPSARYLQWWTGSALVQAIACRLSGAKPFPELMLPFCHLDPWEQTSVKFESKWKTFHSWKCLRSWRLWNGGYFVQGEMKFNARKTISVLRYMTYETLLPKLSQHSGCWWLGALID